MFYIPAQVISILTFPGIVIHQLAVRIFAHLAKIPIFKVRYFQLANHSGYVLHKKPEKFMQLFLITIGPMIINTALCSILGFITFYLKNSEALSLIFGWLAISIGMHAFPYNHEMHEFKNAVNEPDIHSSMYIFAKLLTHIFRLFNFLRSFWIDLIYAVCIMQLLPTLFGVA